MNSLFVMDGKFVKVILLRIIQIEKYRKINS